MHYTTMITYRLNEHLLWGILKKLFLLSVKHKQRSQAI